MISRRWALAALGLAGCATLGPFLRDGGTVRLLAVRRVEWNPARAPIGRVAAVADRGDVVVVLASDGGTVFRAGAIEASDRTTTAWRGGAVLPAPDGSARWLVALDGDGKVRRLRAGNRLEGVSDRYGLERDSVRSACDLGGLRAAFLLDGALAIADATTVRRYDGGALGGLACGGGRVAALDGERVYAIDFATGTNTPSSAPLATRTFPIAARFVAVDGAGHLFAASSRAIYAEGDGGTLALRYVAEGERIHGLAASGRRVWFADGEELGVIDGKEVAVTRGAKLDQGARLVASPTGDVWALADGALLRFAVDDSGATPPGRDWDQAVSPVFGRACAACHLPDGDAGIDLSTAAAWERERVTLRERVLVKRSMPPAGHSLTDADRAALRAFLDAPR